MPQGKNKKKKQQQSNNKKKKGKNKKKNSIVSGGYLPSFDEIMNDYTVDDDGTTLRRKGKIVLTIEKLYHVAITELLELQQQNKDNYECAPEKYIENFDDPNIWLEKLKKVMLSKYDFGDDDTGDILNYLIDNSEEILSNNRVEEEDEDEENENENGGGRGGSNDDGNDGYDSDRGAQHNQL